MTWKVSFSPHASPRTLLKQSLCPSKIGTYHSFAMSCVQDSVAAPSNGFICRMAERLPFLNNVMQVLHIRAGDEDSVQKLPLMNLF